MEAQQRIHEVLCRDGQAANLGKELPNLGGVALNGGGGETSLFLRNAFNHSSVRETLERRKYFLQRRRRRRSAPLVGNTIQYEAQ